MTDPPTDLDPAKVTVPAARARVVGVAIVLVILMLTFVDVNTRHWNIPAFYVFPLLIYARTGHRRALKQTTAFLVFVTYACYFAKFAGSGEPLIWSYRLLNRTFVAIGISFTGFVLNHWLKQRERARWQLGELRIADSDEYTFDQILVAAQQFTAATVAIALAVGIFIADVTTPGQVNTPLLYTVPLLTFIWTRSPKLLWAMLALTLLFAGLGWALGPPPTVAAASVSRILISRVITGSVLVLLTIVLYIWINPSPRKADR